MKGKWVQENRLVRRK